MIIDIIEIKKMNSKSTGIGSVVLKIGAARIFDMNKTEDIWIILSTLIKGGARKIVIDMDSLDFIDSQGISILINSAKLVRSFQGDMALLNVPQRIDTIFRPLNMNRFISRFNNIRDAVNFFRID